MTIGFQEALQATEVLRNDPILYVLVSFMVLAIIAESGMIMFLLKRNHTLQDQNSAMSKAGTEALATFTPLMQNMDGRVLQAFQRLEVAIKDGIQEVKGHINILKKIE